MTGPSFYLDHVFARVSQVISIVDFASRNQMPLHSAAENLHTEIAGDPSRMATLKQLLGEKFFSLRAHWFWFTLNEAKGPQLFPRYTLGGDAEKGDRPQPPASVEQQITALRASLKAREQQLAELREKERRLAARWHMLENSAGWRWLNRWRRLRNVLMPERTWMRRLYDRVKRALDGL